MLQIYSKVNDFFTVIEKYVKTQPFQILERDRPSDVFVSAIRFSLWSEKRVSMRCKDGYPWSPKNDPRKVLKIISLRSEKWSNYRL